MHIYMKLSILINCSKLYFKSTKEDVPDLYTQMKLSYVTTVVPDLFEHDCTMAIKLH
jgi:hypothetical protein